MPTFLITGGLPLALVRGGFDAALLSVFGTLLFWTRVLPRSRARTAPEARAALDRHLVALVRASLAIALLAGLAWLVTTAGVMAGADRPSEALAALPTVLTITAFGHLLLLQAVCVVLTWIMLGSGIAPRRRTLALLGSTALLLLQVGHSHAWSMTGGIDASAILGRAGLLLPSTALHLLAGGAWLGGLLPLLLTVRIAPPRAGATAARSFSLIGKACVATMAVTAGLQSWILVGSVPALFGTAYGWIACLKLAILGVLVVFACINRYRLAPALLADAPETARHRLVASIALQTGFGLLVLLAAGVLSSLPPGLHEPGSGG